MQFPEIHEGDVLLYWRVEPRYCASEEAIKLGEVLEDGLQPREYYHVALAVDSRTKIEAIGGSPVTIKLLVQDGSFDVFRPPCRQDDIRRGLFAVRQDIGQSYDMWLNIDDALRYLTGNRVHLPVKFIYNKERLAKNCVSLLRVYLKAAGVTVRLPVNASPQDVAIALGEYEVE